MTSYKKLSKHARKFLAMTGYTVSEFEKLLPAFQAEFEAHMKTHRLDGKPRGKRRYTDYKNSPLPTIEDKLLFILIYLKQGHLQENQATLFGMHQPDANQWIHLLHLVLNKALAALDELPARQAEELAQKLNVEGSQEPDAELTIFFHDGTERPIVRPTDPEDQKLYYSGKKRQHTLKNIVLITVACKIILLTLTCEGKKHDKKVADEAAYKLPEDSQLYQDTGFQGLKLDKVAIIQPKKKPRGQELTADEKERNQLISKVRIRVEHAISGVKRYRIVKDKLRNRKDDFRDKVMETCCGLHNFRLNFRPWRYGSALI